MMGIKVNVDLSGVNKKLSPANLRAGQYAMANQAMSDMNPFVPYDTKSLRTKVSISMDGTELIWNEKYARAQYYGRSKHATWTKGRMPGTGPYWDKKAAALHMKDWEKAYTKGAGL